MRKGKATKQTILDCGVRIASERGLDALTMGTLAKEVPLSKSGIFAHFNSKEELQQEVIGTVAERFAQTVVEPAMAAPAGIRRVRAFFTKWLEWSLSPELPGGCPFVGASSEFDSQPGPVRNVVANAQRLWIDAFAQVVEDAKARGELRRSVNARRFVFDVYGIYLAHHIYKRLLDESQATAWAKASFKDLLARAKA